MYLLRFQTDRGEPREYFGTTEIWQNQSLIEACSHRLRYHKSKPLTWMRNTVASTLDIAPVGSFSKFNALAREALCIAATWAKKERSVRGACWSGRFVGGFSIVSAMAVRCATKGLSGQAARRALLKHARTFSEQELLRRHLDGLPFSGAKLPRTTLPPTRRVA